MYRFVFDTDVVIAGMRSPSGASAALLGAALENRVRILANISLFFEYESKWMEPDHWKAAGMSREQAKLFVNGLAALIEPVKVHYLWRPMLRDPDDEMVLETAISGGADAIVTFNSRDYGIVPKSFHIEVIKPSVSIRRVRNE